MDTNQSPRPQTKLQNFKDSRSTPIPREQLAILNQSLVYELFPDSEKLTMVEIVDLVTTSQKEMGQQPIHERTIRRAVEALITNGFLKKYGREGNAIIYGKIDASFGRANEELITLAGNLVSVKDFLEIMASPEGDPLSLKVPILSDKIQKEVRRRLVWVLLTSGEPGHNDQLKKVNASLYAILRELEHVQSILKTFVDSPIWYAQYRDTVAYQIREVQKEDPELFNLALDYAKGG